MVQKLFLFLSLALVAKMGLSQDMDSFKKYSENFKFKSEKEQKDYLNFINYKIQKIKNSNTNNENKTQEIIKLVNETQESSVNRYNETLKMYGFIETACEEVLNKDVSKPAYLPEQQSFLSNEELNHLNIDQLAQFYAKSRFNMLNNWSKTLEVQKAYDHCRSELESKCKLSSIDDTEDMKKIIDLIDEKSNSGETQKNE